MEGGGGKVRTGREIRKRQGRGRDMSREGRRGEEKGVKGSG